MNNRFFRRMVLNMDVFRAVAVLVAVACVLTALTTMNIPKENLPLVGEFTASTDYTEMFRHLFDSWNSSWDAGFENHGVGRSMGQSVFYVYGPAHFFLTSAILAVIEHVAPSRVFEVYLFVGVFTHLVGCWVFLKQVLQRSSWTFAAFAASALMPFVFFSPYFTSLQASGTLYYANFGCMLMIYGSALALLGGVTRREMYSYIVLCLLASSVIFSIGVNLVLILFVGLGVIATYSFFQGAQFLQLAKRWSIIATSILVGGLVTNLHAFLTEFLFPKMSLNAWGGYFYLPREDLWPILTGRADSVWQALVVMGVCVVVVLFGILFQRFQRSSLVIPLLIVGLLLQQGVLNGFEEGWQALLSVGFVFLLVLGTVVLRNSKLALLAVWLVVVGLLFQLGAISGLEQFFEWLYNALPQFSFYRTTHRASILVAAGLLLLAGSIISRVRQRYSPSVWQFSAAFLVLVLVGFVKSPEWFYGVSDASVQIPQLSEYRAAAQKVRDSGRKTVLHPQGNASLTESQVGIDATRTIVPYPSLFDGYIPSGGALRQSGIHQTSWQGRLLFFLSHNLTSDNFAHTQRVLARLGFAGMLVNTYDSAYESNVYGATESTDEGFQLLEISDSAPQLSAFSGAAVTNQGPAVFERLQPLPSEPVLFLQQLDLNELSDLPLAQLDASLDAQDLALNQLSLSGQYAVFPENIEYISARENQCRPFFESAGYIAGTSGVHFLSTKPIACRYDLRPLHLPIVKRDDVVTYARLLVPDTSIESVPGEEMRYTFVWQELYFNTLPANLELFSDEIIIDSILQIPTRVLLEKSGEVEEFLREHQVSGAVHEVELENEQIGSQEATFNIDAGESALVVWHEGFTPYWVATDGVEQFESVPVDYGHTGFVIPAGSHSIRIFHKPSKVYTITLWSDSILLVVIFVSVIALWITFPASALSSPPTTKEGRLSP